MPAHKKTHKQNKAPEFVRFQQLLNKRLKALRKEYGYTQEDFTQFNIPRRTYQRIESNPTALNSLHLLYKIADAYGISLSELLDI